MKADTLTYLRFAIAIATIGVVAGHPYLPPKTRMILPDASTQVALTGYIDPATGVNSAAWLEQAENSWRCDFQPKHTLANSCSISLSWGSLYSATTSIASSKQPSMCEQPDVDGDGWGWDSDGICRAPLIAATVPGSDKTSTCPPAVVDLDNDGLSYFAGVPCEVDLSASTSVQRRQISDPLKQHQQLHGVARAHRPIPENLRALDVSAYRGMNLQIQYESSAPFLRMFLQNHNPAYSRAEDIRTNKVLSKLISVEDLRAGNAYVSFDGFNVAEWWIQDFNVPRQWAQPEFDQVVGMGFSLVQFGVHRMKLEKIELVGEWIAFNTLLTGVAIFWLLYVGCEAAFQLQSSRRRALQGEIEIDELSVEAQLLEQEMLSFAQQSTTDSLTGIANRDGLAQRLQHLVERHGLDAQVGIIVIDIDHFKRINVDSGHNVGDGVLRELAQQISKRVRQNDIFARWGGEEFVLVCSACPALQLNRLAEHLRHTVAEHPFTSAENLRLSVSVGATNCQPGESFEDTFRRADFALYEAKRARNCVVYKPASAPEITR